MNNPLIHSYKSFFAGAFVAAWSVYLVLDQVILVPLLGPQSVGIKLTFALFSAFGAYVVFYRLPLFVYERWAWAYLNRDYDISGVWHYTARFDEPMLDHLKKPAADAAREFFKRIKGHQGTVRVRHDCLNFILSDGHGKAGSKGSIGVTWRGAAHFSESDSVVIEFEIALGSAPPTRGRDHLRVTSRSESGRPTVMEGPFLTVPDSQDLVFRGWISYRREVQEDPVGNA